MKSKKWNTAWLKYEVYCTVLTEGRVVLYDIKVYTVIRAQRRNLVPSEAKLCSKQCGTTNYITLDCIDKIFLLPAGQKALCVKILNFKT